MLVSVSPSGLKMITRRALATTCSLEVRRVLSWLIVVFSFKGVRVLSDLCKQLLTTRMLDVMHL